MSSSDFDDAFDLTDATQLLIGGGVVALAIYIEDLLVPVLWKSLTILAAVTLFLLYVNYRKRGSASHILYALGFISIMVTLMGLLLESDIATISIAIVGGFIGGLGFDALLGKGQE